MIKVIKEEYENNLNCKDVIEDLVLYIKELLDNKGIPYKEQVFMGGRNYSFLIGSFMMEKGYINLSPTTNDEVIIINGKRKVILTSDSLADPKKNYQTTTARRVTYKTISISLDVFLNEKEIIKAKRKLNNYIEKVY